MSDEKPWYYMVLRVDERGVEMLLLDSCEDPYCAPGDVTYQLHEVFGRGSASPRSLGWELVA